MYGISLNLNVTPEIIERNPDKPWNWHFISINPNITQEFIERHIDKPWNWYFISENSNITLEFIEKYPDKPWNWNAVSQNPNITLKFIERHLDKISFEYLSYCKFTHQNKKNYEEFMKKNFSLPDDLVLKISKYLF